MAKNTVKSRDNRWALSWEEKASEEAVVKKNKGGREAEASKSTKKEFFF